MRGKAGRLGVSQDTALASPETGLATLGERCRGGRQAGRGRLAKARTAAARSSPRSVRRRGGGAVGATRMGTTEQMRTTLHAVACGLLSLCAVPALAEEADRLPELVVSANRFTQPGVTTPSSISIISRQEIEATGATQVLEVLRGRGGIQVGSYFGDGSRAQVSMRGFGGNARSNTLVLVDGRRLNNNDLGELDFNSIQLGDVERIEIIQGSAGVLFGDQATGGVINIITRRPRGSGVDAQASGGSFATQSQRARVFHQMDNGLSLQASAERRAADNYRDNNELDLLNGFAQALWEHARGEVFAEVQAVEEDLQLPGALYANELALGRRRSVNPGDFTNSDTHVARIGGVQQLTQTWQFLGEVSHRRVDLDNRLTVGGFPSAFTQERRVTAFTPRLVGQWSLPRGEASVTAGADIEEVRYEIDSIFGVTAADQSLGSAYLQGVVPVVSDVSLTLGARQGWYDNAVTNGPAQLDIDDDATAWTAGLAWTPAPAWRVFVRYEDSYRFPYAEEITNSPTLSLRTQRADSYEGGVEWREGRFALKAVGYRLETRDEIDFDSRAALFFGFPVGQNVNLPSTTRTGAILEGAVAVLDTLHVGAEYSYIDAELDQPGGTVRLPFVAEHHGQLWADWRPHGGWQLYADLQAIDERVAAADYDNLLRALPGYAVLNTRVAYRWSRAELGLRLGNVLDQQYSDYAAAGYNPALGFALDTGYYPAPERTWLLSLRVEL